MTLHEYIFEAEAPFRQCHASTVVRLPSGRFVAAWFGGTREGHADVAIWVATRRDERWTPPRQLAKVAAMPHWNPVLFLAPDSVLWLFFKVGANPRTWLTWVTTSDDEGDTWSPPRELIPGTREPRGPVKNKPIVVTDGAWLAGASLQTRRRWEVFVDRSDDDGRTWQRTDVIPHDYRAIRGRGVIQPALWESEPGRVHMLMRSTSGRVCRSDSDDGGRSWSPIYATDLPNNNSGLDVVRVSDGALGGTPDGMPNGIVTLACNPVTRHWRRSPLSLLVSFDNGATWPRRVDVETARGEYSYPAVIAHGEHLALTYTWKRTRIAFWQGSWSKC